MFEELLLTLKSDMMQLCAPIMLVAKALAGIGCLVAAGMISIKSMADNAPFNPWPYLKPISLGFCILYFDILIVGGLDGILQPIAKGTSALAEAAESSNFELSDQLEEARSKLPPNPQVVYYMTKEDQKAEVAATENKGEIQPKDYDEIARKDLAADVEYKKTWIMSVLESIMLVFSYAAKMIVNIIGTFFLIILGLLGPLAFAAACFPPLEGSFSSWLSHYITTSLWLPIANLLTAALSLANNLLCEQQLQEASTSGTVNSILMLAMMVVGIFGYFSVPSLANWIVQSGGSGSYARNMSRTAREGVSKAASGISKARKGLGGVAARYGGGFKSVADIISKSK